ncbi:hypothetical protein [Dinghuibacter silviterrae]|uniref:Uncharacterized protein n=1 Tax=Dinghuibacter silviterrae TaxID=1539049 RepID=A0A4R8DR07_9BACT|nr:hypothetical protein [Dinghuibacter silviterrae]TDX00604.1 hypothetical protein EDB95_1629 [Dinghuibacter silviterrae]
MDENLRHILNDSVGTISKLQLLSAFFEDEMVYKIYVKTQVIHQLFETNRDLDINKLSLFHVQFTDTVITLLRKIKKTNEQNVNLLYEEIRVNREMIDRLGSSVYTEAGFNQEKATQSGKVSLSLRRLYDVLAADSSDYPLSKNINAFSAHYAQDFYADISPDLFGALIQYNPAEVYINAHAVIHRRLMGQLHKVNFNCTFQMGLKAGSQVLEVYKFEDPSPGSGAAKHFLYLANGNVFLFVDPVKLQGLDTDSGASKKVRLTRELTDKNTRLESNIAAAKTFIPVPVKDLLAEYYRKISDINFLEQSDFEVQANILKSMLNTDII